MTINWLTIYLPFTQTSYAIYNMTPYITDRFSFYCIPHTNGLNYTKCPPSEIVTFLHSLTTHEGHILAFALHGLRNQEIAGRFDIVVATVITHRRNIMVKWHMAYLTVKTGKCAANEMLAVIRPYAGDYLPHVQ